MCSLLRASAASTTSARSLAARPTRPGVYLFHDRHGQVLYVGRARNLRARLRTYFQSEGQRPSVEAALLAPTGSVARPRLRARGGPRGAATHPRASAAGELRSRRKEHGVYLRRRGDEFVVTKRATELGLITSRRRASLAARALARSTSEELDDLLEGGPLPRLRTRLDLAECLRYEEAPGCAIGSRHPSRSSSACAAWTGCAASSSAWSLPRSSPAGTRRSSRAAAASAPFTRSRRRLNAPRIAAALELCRAAGEQAEQPLTPAQAEDLLLLDGFIRHPTPELALLPLDAERIAAHLSRAMSIAA